MNTLPGILGKKLGCTQIFNDDGSVTRVTVVEAGPCTVVRKRTMERDGYTALQLSFGLRREKTVNKPNRGYFEKNGVKTTTVTKKGKEVPMLPSVLRELRLSAEDLAKFEVGQILNASDVLKEGQFIDVCGITRGFGFQGVFKRHNFKGFVRTHGTHEYKRHGGSIGTNMTPGRTMPGKKMPGQKGNARHTTLNLKVAKIVQDQNLVLITGSIPGARNSTVVVRGAVKRGRHA
ncbi:MAG: 50S ribosomal protein L3 [Deltaproteobacteria bacterium]